MKLSLAAIANRAPSDPFQTLTALYLERLQQYADVEAKTYRTEQAFAESIVRLQARTPPTVVLLDSRGKSMTSEDFAQWIGRRRDQGAQNLIFAIGPANGWSESTRAGSVAAPSAGTRASPATQPSAPTQPGALLLSLGPMTLPHELARVVLAEQLYRAFTILANHPYHCGH